MTNEQRDELLRDLTDEQIRNIAAKAIDYNSVRHREAGPARLRKLCKYIRDCRRPILKRNRERLKAS